MQQPPEGRDNTQVEAWMEKIDGVRICEGTASIGNPSERSALHARKLDKNPSGELRILASATAGDEFPVVVG